MRLINNFFNNTDKIEGFTKEELIEIKSITTKLKSEQTQLEEFIHSKFSSEILEFYSNYIDNIKSFIDIFLNSTHNTDIKINFNYYYLKSGILNEINRISNNLLNLKLNGRNIKRFLKNNTYLDDFINTIQNLQNEYEDLKQKLKSSINYSNAKYNDFTYIWIEINKLKNSIFKINDNLDDLKFWEEINDFYGNLSKISSEPSQKKKNKKKQPIIIHHFNDFYNIYISNKDENIDFYSNLIAFLYNKNLLEEFEGGLESLDDYANILDRKEIKNKIQSKLNLLFKELVEDKLNTVLKEITELDKTFKLENEKNDINLNTLLNQKFDIYLPQIIDYYLNRLEMKYQSTISDLKESDEFKSIKKFYTEKVDILNSKIEEIEDYIKDLEVIIKPYESLTDNFEKIISNVYSKIERRKNEYIYYLKTIRKERLKDNVRTFIYDKIAQLNELMVKYQDDTSLLVREEFPQLKKIREIFSEYKKNIQEIKNEVYKKLDQFKDKDIDIYQIIKQWEDNFTLKKQQLGFLFSVFLNKMFKLFEDLIEEEKNLFDHITEITEQKKEIEKIPLNFAVSKILAEKLTEDELNERIQEIQFKIENLNNEIELYYSELSDLRKNLANKVKIREGITNENIQCSICRKNFDFAKDKIIKCPFCDAVYHYLCVAFWLGKYNSCPSCQNTFLDPNAGIFSDQE